MSDTALRITVEGQAATVRALAARKTALLRANAKALRLGSEAVLARAVQKVSGEVLKVQTGTLRRRLTYYIAADGGSSRIGSPTEYAARHEFGFTGLEAVSGHTRHITHAFGRRLGATQSLSEVVLGALRGTIGVRGQRFRRSGARDVQVRPFIRRANTPARPFLRPSLAESKDAIRNYFIEAARQALNPSKEESVYDALLDTGVFGDV